jgi:hypothetical protein
MEREWVGLIGTGFYYTVLLYVSRQAEQKTSVIRKTLAFFSMFKDYVQGKPKPA